MNLTASTFMVTWRLFIDKWNKKTVVRQPTWVTWQKDATDNLTWLKRVGKRRMAEEKLWQWWNNDREDNSEVRRLNIIRGERWQFHLPSHNHGLVQKRQRESDCLKEWKTTLEHRKSSQPDINKIVVRPKKCIGKQWSKLQDIKGWCFIYTMYEV